VTTARIEAETHTFGNPEAIQVPPGHGRGRIARKLSERRSGWPLKKAGGRVEGSRDISE